MTQPTSAEPIHRISVVIPVYQGELTLAGVCADLVALTEPFLTPDGHLAAISEIVLVHDHGPDQSDRVIRELRDRHPEVVKPIWLSRNFGQHPATLAGMTAATGDWVVTMDEDGQHDPVFLAPMLDVAMATRRNLVYAAATNAAPHGALRNLASALAKRIVDTLVGGDASSLFHSFRFILGDVARKAGIEGGSGVYLDIALSWVAGPVATCPVELRDEGDRPSGYRLRSLVSHFWRMVLTAGTRPLRLVAVLGSAFAALGILVAILLAGGRIFGWDEVEPGWTSLMVVVLLCTGALLFALGVLAEYLGIAVNMALGKPAYLVIEDRADGPMGRAPRAPEGPGAPQAER